MSLWPHGSTALLRCSDAREVLVFFPKPFQSEEYVLCIIITQQILMYAFQTHICRGANYSLDQKDKKDDLSFELAMQGTHQ